MPRIYTRTVISRGARPDWNYVVREVDSEFDNRIKPDVLGYFFRIVASWQPEHRPLFKARKRITPQEIVLWVYPTGPGKKIWMWVSITGTKPHLITAKDAMWLVFVWGGPGSYQARTTRSGGYKGPGKPTGTIQKMKQIQHPGFQPRRFEHWVAEWYKPRFYKYVEAAMRRGIRKAKAHAK